MRLLRTPLVIEAGSRSRGSAGLLGWARPEGEVEVQTRLDLWYFKAGAFEWIMMRSPRALVAMAELGVARDQFELRSPSAEAEATLVLASPKKTCVAFQTFTLLTPFPRPLENCDDLVLFRYEISKWESTVFD